MKKNLIRKILLNVTLGGALLLPNILPVTTEAAATTKSKTDYLSGTTVGGTYQFGHYWQSYKGSGDESDKGNYNKDAITWKVLANNNGIVTLLSEKVLYGDTFDSESNVWSESDIKDTLNNTEGYGFAGDAFTAAELAMIEGKKIDGDTSKIYLLDYDDVKDGGTYNFSGSGSRTATATEYAQGAAAYGGNTASSEWWLRSHNNFDVGELPFADYVMADGNVHSRAVNSQDIGVRPAMDLDLSNLIFVTAAERGKTTAIAGNSIKFAEISDTSTLDLWMDDTVNEDNRVTGDVAVGGMKLGKESDSSKITFNFTGAADGTDSYVSALFFDKNGYEYNSTASELSTGNLVGYGKGNTSADGTTEIDITELGTTGTYKAELFNENGMFIGKRAEVKGTFAWKTSKLIYTVDAKDVDFDITVGGGSAVFLTGTGDNVLGKNIILEGDGEVNIGDGSNEATEATVSTSLSNIDFGSSGVLVVNDKATLNLIGENTLTKDIYGTDGTTKLGGTLNVLADELEIQGTLDGNGKTLNMTTGVANSAI
ncbi:MAG: hypothetical protein KBS60_07160, partial [Phascolarctobacterium sp.]|nr:hypothetical protein [Candidatus Phascolarctobacterium caballi]